MDYWRRGHDLCQRTRSSLCARPHNDDPAGQPELAGYSQARPLVARLSPRRAVVVLKLLAYCGMKFVQKRVHFSHDLSFVAQIHIVVCVRNHDNVRTWNTLAEVL